MLHSIKKFWGRSVLAADGEVGKALDILFDDLDWTVRYAAVDTASWFDGRRVLIAPEVFAPLDDERETLSVHLNRNQVASSPPVEADLPVSRQREEEIRRHYGWAFYWIGRPFTGEPMPPSVQGATPDSGKLSTSGDPHLRSAKEVSGYHIAANDGGLGHIEDFLLDDESWRLCYLVVDTRDWWPGRRVLLSPFWVDVISWAERKVYVHLPRDIIKNVPTYDPSAAVTRTYEKSLHDYYGRPAYWI